jgi:hypothetical protein
MMSHKLYKPKQQIVVFHISVKPLSMPSSCYGKERIMLDADFKESADGMLGLPMYNSHFILALL